MRKISTTLGALLVTALLASAAFAQPAPFNYPPSGGGGSSSCSSDISTDCSTVLGVGHVTTGVLGASNGGTGQATAPAARGASGLDIDELTGHGNSSYTILATDRVVATNAAFTAAQTWTLPAANSLNPGQTVTIIDAQGTVTSTNTLTIARAGTDTIDGGTSYVIAAAFNYVTLISDGVSKWTVAACSAGCTFTGTTTFAGATTITNAGALDVGSGITQPLTAEQGASAQTHGLVFTHDSTNGNREVLGVTSTGLARLGLAQNGFLFNTGQVALFNQSNMEFGSDAAGIRLFNGTAPTMGACGTSPSVQGTDNNMLVTVGTGGSATSCAVTFAGTWTTSPGPVCIAQNNTDKVAYSMVTTTTTMTITAAAAFTASSKFHVHCWGL